MMGCSRNSTPDTPPSWSSVITDEPSVPLEDLDEQEEAPQSPISEPTVTQNQEPTKEPTTEPTKEQTVDPTMEPETELIKELTATPTKESVADPTKGLTATPTKKPTAKPTKEPISAPPKKPTAKPTQEPTTVPTKELTASPTQEPSIIPTKEPEATPTQIPTTVPTPTPTVTPTPATETPDTIPTVNIQVGNKSFTLTMYDNSSAQALLDKLPLTLDMDELNRNEKYYYFSERFPSDSERVGNINAGELMLYGSDCLVLFYESFSTSYSYTKLGYMENISGLKDALGSGSVQVTFSINK